MESVPTILEVVCRITGLGFAAVARVTDERWVACGVRDEIQFGLKPGGELPVASTICHEIHGSRHAVVINHVAADNKWAEHPTPKQYGFQSYISVPIILNDDSFFGTLCAIDPRPAQLDNPETLGMFQLFAQLIARNLEAEFRHKATEAELGEERNTSGHREQFLAVLGHDLRAPIRATRCLAELLLRSGLNPRQAGMAEQIRDSSGRMGGLVDNLVDLARGRLGGGFPVERDPSKPLEPVLRDVLGELQAIYPDRQILSEFDLPEPVNVDPLRIAQMLSNLLGNALLYGRPDAPVHVHASAKSGVFELSVANSGEPIPEAALLRLFQPFFRNHINTGGVQEGLGLGLYIAHEIAKAHGGTLSVVSGANGTRFTFQLRNG